MGGVRYEGDTGLRKLVLNAAPFIYFCRAGLAGKLIELKPFFKLLTTEEVYSEVYVLRIEKKVDEADALKGLFGGGVIEVRRPNEDGKKVRSLSPSAGIHPGEVSVISLALELKATAVIDDRRARHVARSLGVKLTGTPGLIIELARRKAISKEEAGRAFEKIVDEGWYCSAKLFSSIIRTIEEIQP